MNPFRNRLNSIRSTADFSDLYFADQRPVSGRLKANQAFNVQAKEAITM